MFVIKVPKDFGNKAIRWTIVANGETQSIPFTLNKGYPITPFKELGMGNQPPMLWFAEGGAKVTGPPVGVAGSFSGAVNQPVAITFWAEDVKEKDSEGGQRGHRLVPQVSRSGHRHLRRARASRCAKAGEAMTAPATFSAPGEYLLRVQANDESGEGGGGFQCCWTNTYVKVTVK